MQLNGEQLIPGTLDQVWACLNDMALIQRCIPGCEGIAPLGDDRHEVAIVAAVGPVKARFRGTIALRDIAPREGYVIAFEGNGGVAGFARGQAEVRLDAVDAQQTRLRHQVQAEVGGKLAQIGSRLVDAAAAKVSADFFQALKREMAQPAAPAPGMPAPLAGPGVRPLPALTGGDRVRVEVALVGGGWFALALALGALAGAFIATALRG